MADGGEYRSVRRVLFDRAEFQQLSAGARHVLLTLKLTTGLTGFDVSYPAALRHELSVKTGLHVEAIDLALVELELGDWIRRDDNMLWVIDQLIDEPHMRASDPKHRMPVARYLSGLPRTDILGQFVRAHAEFIRPAEDAFAQPLAWAFEDPSKGPERVIEAGERRAESGASRAEQVATRAESGAAPASAPLAAPLADAIAATADEGLAPELEAWVARYYGRSIDKRRADVRDQLERLARGEAILFRRGANVAAGSARRLIGKALEMLAAPLADEDKAIVVLLTKLNDTTDQSAAQVTAESAKRESEERATAEELVAADRWLTDRDDVSSRIDAEIVEQIPDSVGEFAGIARRTLRSSLVLAAWRADGAPGAPRSQGIGQRAFDTTMRAIADIPQRSYRSALSSRAPRSEPARPTTPEEVEEMVNKW